MKIQQQGCSVSKYPFNNMIKFSYFTHKKIINKKSSCGDLGAYRRGRKICLQVFDY